MTTSDRHANRPTPSAEARGPAGVEWTTDDAPRLAREAGLRSLGDHHWKVIVTCREEAARTGRIPNLKRLAALTGFDTAELQRLFPGDVEAIVARIAGLRFRR